MLCGGVAVWLLGAGLADAAGLGAGEGSYVGGCVVGSGGGAGGCEPMMSPGVLLLTSAAKVPTVCDGSGKAGFGGAFT